MHTNSRSLQEEVANKGENPAWVIKLKNQRDQFEKDAKNDLSKNQKQNDDDAFRSLSPKRKGRGRSEKRREKKKEKKIREKPKASVGSHDEARV